jgi:hypothetical protein
MKRTKFIGAIAAVFAIGAGMTSGPPMCLAAAPIVGGQAPGYYRIFVGRFEVTALLDRARCGACFAARICRRRWRG